jgi:hypothetical protein
MQDMVAGQIDLMFTESTARFVSLVANALGFRGFGAEAARAVAARNWRRPVIYPVTSMTTSTFVAGDDHVEQSKIRSGAPVRLNTSFLSSQSTENFTPFGRMVEPSRGAWKVTVSPDLL